MQTFDDFNHFIEEKTAVIAYFSHDTCNVCKVLKPKVKELVTEEFPKIQFAYVNVKETPEIAAQLSIFTVPTIVIYFEGKEFVRKSRSIGIDELREAIDRPYNLLFD